MEQAGAAIDDASDDEGAVCLVRGAPSLRLRAQPVAYKTGKRIRRRRVDDEAAESDDEDDEEALLSVVISSKKVIKQAKAAEAKVAAHPNPPDEFGVLIPSGQASVSQSAEDDSDEKERLKWEEIMQKRYEKKMRRKELQKLQEQRAMQVKSDAAFEALFNTDDMFS
jgi:hypothetical protein